MNEIKLKSCPFCGGNGVVRTSMDGYDESKVFSVSCTNKGCIAYLTRDYWERDINGLVKKWNTRYEPPTPGGIFVPAGNNRFKKVRMSKNIGGKE